MDQADVTLKSLTFKTEKGFNNIASVQCLLSNGKASKVFRQAGGTFERMQTIEFDPSSPIRAVRAAERGNAVYQIKFLDSTDEVVKAYYPGTHKFAESKIYLEKNQELIGVYGKYDFKTRNKKLGSFGFIVKVRKDV